MNKYLQFYVEGYQLTGRTSLAKKADIDLAVLAESVATREPDSVLKELIEAAVAEGARNLDSGKLRKDWVDKNQSAIDAAGGDAKLAYAAYCRGQVDALVYESLSDYTGEIAEVLGMEEDDDDEDDDDEDDDDEDDDDDDDDKD